MVSGSVYTDATEEVQGFVIFFLDFFFLLGGGGYLKDRGHASVHSETQNLIWCRFHAFVSLKCVPVDMLAGWFVLTRCLVRFS